MYPVRQDTYFVILCDWLGNCTWASAENYSIVKGDFIWDHLVDASQAKLKSLISRAVVLREPQQIEIVAEGGDLFHGQLLPIDCSDSAVCMLAIRVPSLLSRITVRERGCLELLATGTTTKQIAIQLKVSVSTVQTHLIRARRKLELPTSEALASYAARYFYPTDGSLGLESN